MAITSPGEARRVVAARWKDQRPRRLAEELMQRASEVPADARERLRQALEAAELGGAA